MEDTAVRKRSSHRAFCGIPHSASECCTAHSVPRYSQSNCHSGYFRRIVYGSDADGWVSFSPHTCRTPRQSPVLRRSIQYRNSPTTCRHGREAEQHEDQHAQSSSSISRAGQRPPTPPVDPVEPSWKHSPACESISQPVWYTKRCQSRSPACGKD